jgi:hypothetical protein
MTLELHWVSAGTRKRLPEMAPIGLNDQPFRAR